MAAFLLLSTAVACGAPPSATDGERVEAASQASCACPVEKITFPQSEGCRNDGSVEFCIPTEDAALRGRLDRLPVELTYAPSSGRAGCDRERETLVLFPTPKEDRRVCSSDGALRRGTWAQLCAIAQEPSVAKIVPTFYE